MALNVPEIYIPFAPPSEPVPEVVPKPLVLDYTTLKRLDPPLVVAPSGYKLIPEVQKRLADLNSLYLTLHGKAKCYRCCNTGIVKWVAKGATAKVCQCVRDGAIVIEASKATPDAFVAPQGEQA